MSMLGTLHCEAFGKIIALNPDFAHSSIRSIDKAIVARRKSYVPAGNRTSPVSFAVCLIYSRCFIVNVALKCANAHRPIQGGVTGF